MSHEASQQLKEILPMIIENDSEADDVEMLHAAASLLAMSGLPVKVTVPISQASVTELTVSDPTQHEVKNAEGVYRLSINTLAFAHPFLQTSLRHIRVLIPILCPPTLLWTLGKSSILVPPRRTHSTIVSLCVTTVRSSTNLWPLTDLTLTILNGNLPNLI